MAEFLIAYAFGFVLVIFPALILLGLVVLWMWWTGN